ncbi:hypothetical protein IFU08_16025 [Microbacterium sp. CFBP 8790]|uniref:hypothetical protein n=1 Tax=unclassified Microbacterium TaxID=2609290 RepID=UPI00177F6C2A|nr:MULTISPECIES: hypothetical protein [unclassified Microbacterium]MBD8207859.1 hypothetical protein [Microbacterium sp. CFBP 8801]MBD8511064.1 hypothetical protein [Microbacterium sp. CFBP 8790]
MTVVVADGTFLLEGPLRFGVEDGGRNGHSVTWRAAPDAAPVISGGRAVEDWTGPDASGVWSAPLESDFDFRQLYVDGRQATRSHVELDANRITWNRTGFSVDPAYLSSDIGRIWSVLKALPAGDQQRVELRSRGSWTDRIAPVSSLAASSAVMQQPSWDNNTWGWDTIDKPLPDNSHRTLRLQNARVLVDQPGEWFFDQTAGALHYKPAVGVDPNNVDIVAPQQQTLLSVSGESSVNPVRNLRFEGLSFEHSSDLRPNTDEGFANQQNGSFISGRVFALVDPVTKDLPTSDQRVFVGAEQAPVVRLLRLGSDGVHRYLDDGSAVAAADKPRLIDVRDYPNLPLNSAQLAAWNAAHPQAPKSSCARPFYPNECIAFESWRDLFEQASSAVQVTAATNVTFSGSTFAHIGGNALGIGNDSGATLSGVGLAAQDVSVLTSTFRDIAGTAIAAGGVSPEAHHPSREASRNARLIVSDNRITGVGRDYFDRSAILVTYFDGAEVVHNELSDGAYDAIDTGWGWGVPDAGGNAVYQGRGAYLFMKRYADDDPTTNRNIHVARNAMWDFKKEGADGGILYNLGATPGSSWEGNHVVGATGFKLYFDEGTRYMTAKDNVLSAGGIWTFANGFSEGTPTPAKGQPNTTRDNTVDGTWALGGGLNLGPWCYDSAACDPAGDGRYNNRITTRSQIGISELPLAAQKVVAAAGIRPEHRRPGDRVGEPRGLDLALTRDASGAQVVTATVANLGTDPLGAVTVRATGSSGVTLTPLAQAPVSLAPGATGTATWKVSGAAAITDGTVSVSTSNRSGAVTTSTEVKRTLPVVLGGPVDPALTVAGFGTYLAPQAVRSGESIALQSSGRDIGIAGDEYTTVYSRDGLANDGTVTTRLDSVEGAFYRSGLSVRNDLGRTADAAVPEKSTGYATLVAEPGWIAFRADRSGDGVIDTQIDQAAVPDRPLWLRITRTGNTLKASYSLDGNAYTDLRNTVDLTGADTGRLDAGLVHSSADRIAIAATQALTTSTAIFSGLRFTGTGTMPEITAAPEKAGVAGRPYSATLTATNNARFAIVDGSLPEGLTLAATGAITGTPTRAGAFTATIEARTDAGAATTAVRIVVRESAPAAPEVRIAAQEPTVPGLTSGSARVEVRNPTVDPTRYSVVVTNAAGATVHSADLTAAGGATAATRAERLGGGVYTVTVLGDDASAQVAQSFTITNGAFTGLPAPWRTSSLQGATASSMSVEGSQIAVLGQRSADISGENPTKTDSYSTVYQPDVLGADDSVQVTVTGQERIGDFTKSGLIIRDDLAVSTSGSSGASNGTGTSSGEAVLALTPTRGIRFTVENGAANWYTVEAASTTAWNVAQTIPSPITLKLSREGGTTLVASYSLDGGATFQVLGTRTDYFAAGRDRAVDAGVVQSTNAGVTGNAGSASFRDFLTKARTAAPGLTLTASSPETDGSRNGTATATVTNPTDREQFVEVTASRTATGGMVFRSGATVPARGSAIVIVPRLTAGEYTVMARDSATGASSSGKVSITASRGVSLQPTAAPRCIAGTVQLIATVRNTDGVPIGVKVSSPYGEKATAAVQPGTATTAAFATRLTAMPAGVLTVVATGPARASSTVQVSYGAVSCR